MDLHRTLLAIAPHYAGFSETMVGLVGLGVGLFLAYFCSEEVFSGFWIGWRVYGLAAAGMLWGGAGGFITGKAIAVHHYVANAEYVLKADFSVAPSYDIDPNFFGKYTPRNAPFDGQSGQSTGFSITGTLHHPAQTRMVLGKPVVVPAYDDVTESFVVTDADAALLEKTLLTSSDPGAVAAGRGMASAQ